MAVKLTTVNDYRLTAVPAVPVPAEQPLPTAIDTAQYGDPGWLPEKLEK